MLNKLLVGAVAAEAMSVPLAGVASAAPPSEAGNASVSVSVNGTSKVDIGDSTATSTTGNTAIAVRGSAATARDGTGNKAIAVNHSVASAIIGNNNTATAINNSTASLANHFLGNDNNTVTATCGGSATASDVSGQTVTDRGSPPCR